MAKRFNYSRAERTAQRLIDKFGGDGQILRYTPGAGQPGSRDKPSYTPEPIKVVAIDFARKLIDGVNVQQTDKQLFLSTQGLTAPPALTDRIIDASGEEYEIVPPIKPLSPAGHTVFYELQGRR